MQTTSTIPNDVLEWRPQGLVFRIPTLSIREWEAVGRQLADLATQTNWYIGDWLVYGNGRGDYGEYYQFASRILGRSIESLSQCARVSLAFSIQKRTFNVPWSLYRECLRLPGNNGLLNDRIMALRAAQENRWTKDDMISFIQSREVHEPAKGERMVTTSKIEQPTFPSRMGSKNHHRWVVCPKCQHQFEPKKGTV